MLSNTCNVTSDYYNGSREPTDKTGYLSCVQEEHTCRQRCKNLYVTNNNKDKEEQITSQKNGQDLRSRIRREKYFLKLRPTQIRDFKMLQLSNLNRVMEPDTISKNGASSKSLTSRGNFFIFREMRRKIFLFFTALMFTTLGIINAQVSRTQVESQVQSSVEKGKTLKRKVAIARFTNETMYGKGIFYDKKNDPMAKQALDILSTRLAATEKFILLERSDIDKAMLESETEQEKPGVLADYIIVGSITEFGRKNTGNTGVFSNTKTQTVEAGVSIRLIDVSSGLIIYSEEAKGTAETSSKTTMGLGGSADFDASLSDKAISAAISQLTENIINNCMNRAWKAYFLTFDEGVYYVSGGASQGLAVGDRFTVKEKGKSVKNPQTGMTMELPGKTAGKIRITFTGGDSVESEFSIAEFTDGQIDASQLSNYYIIEEE